MIVIRNVIGTPSAVPLADAERRRDVAAHDAGLGEGVDAVAAVTGIRPGRLLGHRAQAALRARRRGRRRHRRVRRRQEADRRARTRRVADRPAAGGGALGAGRARWCSSARWSARSDVVDEPRRRRRTRPAGRRRRRRARSTSTVRRLTIDPRSNAKPRWRSSSSWSSGIGRVCRATVGPARRRPELTATSQLRRRVPGAPCGCGRRARTTPSTSSKPLWRWASAASR